nr:MAG TPA: hypothetical protein [Caudoviricetes sp.]
MGGIAVTERSSIFLLLQGGKNGKTSFHTVQKKGTKGMTLPCKYT